MNRFNEKVLQPSNRIGSTQQDQDQKRILAQDQGNQNNYYDQNQSYLLQGQNQTFNNFNNQQIVKQNDQYQGQFNDNPYYNQAVFEQPCRISIITKSQNEIQNYGQQELENQEVQSSQQGIYSQNTKNQPEQNQTQEPTEQYYQQKERYEDLRSKYYNQNYQRNYGYGNNLYAQASLLTSKYPSSQNFENESQYTKQYAQLVETQNQDRNQQINKQVQQDSKIENQFQCCPPPKYNPNQTFTNQQHQVDPQQYQIKQPNQSNQTIQHRQQATKITIQNTHSEQTSQQMQQKYRERFSYLDELKRRIPQDDFYSQSLEQNQPSNYERQFSGFYQQNQIRPQPAFSRLQEQREGQKMYKSARINQQYQEYPGPQLYQQQKYNEHQTSTNGYDRGGREDSYEREKNLFFQKTSHLKQHSYCARR